MTELTEEGLLRRVRAGDTDAFGVLVERHMRRAYVHALGIRAFAIERRHHQRVYVVQCGFVWQSHRYVSIASASRLRAA